MQKDWPRTISHLHLSEGFLKKNLKKSFGMNLFKPAKSILAQRSKVHNLVGAYESRTKYTQLGVQVE